MTYPHIEINLDKLRKNTQVVTDICHKEGVSVSGVVKVLDGDPKCSLAMAESGCDYIASSRLIQLKKAKEAGVKLPLMLIRIPMMSEIKEMVSIVDTSLNSELSVIEKINEEAGLTGVKHNIVLMIELGDLREGIWGKEEILKAATYVEDELENVHLLGVGTNLGCYGSIAPTSDKLEELVQTAEMIEEKIGRQLEMISGGGTTSLPRILDGDMPERINNLRIGEGIVINKDNEDLYGYKMEGMYRDAIIVKAEVVESKVKPSHPIGEIMYDAFRNKPEYEDLGDRKRVLLAIGKVDYAYPDQIYPMDKGAIVLGASSDHTILDVEDSEIDYYPGDIIEIDLTYPTMAIITGSAELEKVYV